MSSLLVELPLKAVTLGTEPSTLLSGHLAVIQVIAQANINVNDLLDDIILGHVILLVWLGVIQLTSISYYINIQK